MKKIVLILDPEVYDEVQTAVAIRHMMGNLYGAADEFLRVLISAISQGKAEVQIGKQPAIVGKEKVRRMPK